MTLSQAVTRYVTHKQTIGMRFCRQARTLKSFCRTNGEVDVDCLDPKDVMAFITGTGPVTLNARTKYDTLRGLYKFLIARGYATHNPLPRAAPKPSINFVPYIYSREELKRLFLVAESVQSPLRLLEGQTLRSLLLLLYGTGLRLNEALSLKLEDVDRTEKMLRVREGKFFKTRLVPICVDLQTVIDAHLVIRCLQKSRPHDHLFVTRTGDPVPDHLVQAAFRRSRLIAKVSRHDHIHQQPRLHDLRHSAAVHRVIAWYRDGADVQRLLPKLATFLGHIDIASTQRYLTLVPELLKEANIRFERYAMGGSHE
jgi:integrase/recombinase XerD